MYLIPIPTHYVVEIATSPLFGTMEPDWIRRVGVVVALIGAGAAAPDGVAWLLRVTKDAVLGVWQWLRSALGRLWAWLRRRQIVQPPAVYARAGGSAGMGSAGSGEVFVWNPGASADAKADLLYKQMMRAYAKMERIRQESEARDVELRQLIEERTDKLEASHEELRRLVEARERLEARVDGRGLLLIAFGILLTGIPDELAAFAPLGWVFVGIAAVLALVIVRAVRSDRAEAAI